MRTCCLQESRSASYYYLLFFFFWRRRRDREGRQRYGKERFKYMTDSNPKKNKTRLIRRQEKTERGKTTTTTKRNSKGSAIKEDNTHLPCHFFSPVLVHLHLVGVVVDVIALFIVVTHARLAFARCGSRSCGSMRRGCGGGNSRRRDGGRYGRCLLCLCLHL